LKWNGYTARYENGISGSHNALLYLAEALAKIGHIVIITSTNNNIIEGNYLNVEYVNSCNIKETDYHYIVTHNLLSGLFFLHNISFVKLIILTHNDLCDYDNLFSIPKEKVIIGYISEFAKMNILNLQPFLKDYESMLLYNSMDMKDLPIIKPKKDQLCYFACLDRGFKMVSEILKQLNYTLVTNTYSPNYRDLLQPNTQLFVSSNTSKKCIHEHISESKYFIYPLINLDNNCIHYDTFAYCVLESLLLGVVVIAPKIGVFEELYGDSICYIDTDDIIPKEDLLYWKKQNSNFGYPLIDRYVSMIHRLDNDDELRNRYIQKGIALREKFNSEVITQKLLDKINTTTKYDLKHLSTLKPMPNELIQYLNKLKISGFEPKVIYDIGSCVLHWTNAAKEIWPNATYILFDAFSEAEFLYNGYNYHIGVLSDKDNQEVKFYQNEKFPTGNSYYREIGCTGYFPENNYIRKITSTLDTVVKQKGFPLPDFVKIDVQGCEIDIIKGGIETLKHATRMIVELQHTDYNFGAMKADESLPIIESMGFKCIDPQITNTGVDGDYGFVNTHKDPLHILTIFAGRRSNLEILTKYLKKALEQNIIQEVHFWNNTRTIEDEEYLKTISNVKRTSSTGSGNYILITPEINDSSFELMIQATNDIHVKLVDVHEYEIVLGGWGNTKSVIRKNNQEIYSINGPMGNGIYKFEMKNGIRIYKNSVLVLNHYIDLSCKDIYVKTGHGCVGEFKYKTTHHHGFYFMDTCEKSWRNYYQYYENNLYDVILKCDDDIVFMDLNQLPSFIQFVKENDYDLVFANTINNGVSAHIQQEKYKLIPKNLMELEYPHEGIYGSLWENGSKAEVLHHYFIDNLDTFLKYDYKKEIIPITTRFSINFFGYKGSQWNKIKDCYVDDEYNLTVDYVKNANFKNVYYSDFYVSHLSFGPQQMNFDLIRQKYNELCDTIVKDMA